ncbi:MAG: glycosyltransferase [Acidocella sp.]|nr:glycosyltransferase [Acidocella sp.]
MPIEETGALRLVAGHRPPPGAYQADIIILSLNRLAEVQAAVESACGQTGITAHITVLDQGSDPEMQAALAGWARRRVRNQHGLGLYAAGRNLGVAGGRNAASALGHGQVIIALDNDAIFESATVARRAVATFARQPDLAAIGFNILAADGQHPDLFSWGYPARLVRHFRDCFETATFVGAGHAIRRAAWDAVGGYDADLFFTWEEYDFCLRVIARGWRVRYDGRLGVIHNPSPAARVGWQAARVTYFVRNRLIIGRKWGASWAALSPRILGYVIKGALNGRLAATVSGVAAAMRSARPEQHQMSEAMRDYLFRADTRHRGGWLARLRGEVLGRIRTDP